MFFYFIKSETSDSFVNHFDGHFAYLKTLDFYFNAYRSSLSTTTPSHLSFCAEEIVGVVVFPIKLVIFSSIPSLSIYFLYKLEEKKKSIFEHS